MVRDHVRKTSLAIAIIAWIVFAISTAFQQEGVFLLSSPIACIASAVAILVVGYSIRKYRASIYLMASGALFWALADILLIFAEQEGSYQAMVQELSDWSYRMTSYVYLLALISFVVKEYRSKDYMHILANTFIFTIGIFVISSGIVSVITGRTVNWSSFLVVDLFQVLIAVFIMVITLSLLADRGIEQWSLIDILCFVGFITYGGLDARYCFFAAMDLNPESLVSDVLFVASIVILACAYSCSEAARVLLVKEKKDTRKEHYAGDLAAIVMAVLGILLYLMHGLLLTTLLMLLIASLAYFLVSKTIQAYELNKELLKEREAENESLHDQVEYQQKELASANERLELATYMDGLTGLWNRSYWNIYYMDVLDMDPDVRIVLFSLDINFFKLINDTYGQDVGDRVLIEFAHRIASLQDENIHGFRTGADQFMVSCVDVNKDFNVVEFSQKLMDVLDNLYVIDYREFHVSASIGAAVYPNDTNNIEKLMSYAEFARDTQKHASNVSTCAFYTEGYMPKLQRKFQLEQRLKDINYDTDLELYFQPMLNATTNQIFGMEALVRWHDAELGLIEPEEFIPLAEELGMMLHMGEWILAESVHQIFTWNEKYQKDWILGINISKTQIQDEMFAENFIEMVETIGAKPEWFDFEITENVALRGISGKAEFIERLQKFGLQMTVDNFGTGFGTFTNMITFQFDNIKLDCDLVRQLQDSHNTRVVVDSIVRMAKGMGLGVVAEGIETKEQLDILQDIGCHLVQGFYFSKPLAALDFEERWLQ